MPGLLLWKGGDLIYFIYRYAWKYPMWWDGKYEEVRYEKSWRKLKFFYFLWICGFFLCLLPSFIPFLKITTAQADANNAQFAWDSIKFFQAIKTVSIGLYLFGCLMVQHFSEEATQTAMAVMLLGKQVEKVPAIKVRKPNGKWQSLLMAVRVSDFDIPGAFTMLTTICLSIVIPVFTAFGMLKAEKDVALSSLCEKYLTESPYVIWPLTLFEHGYRQALAVDMARGISSLIWILLLGLSCALDFFKIYLVHVNPLLKPGKVLMGYWSVQIMSIVVATPAAMATAMLMAFGFVICVTGTLGSVLMLGHVPGPVYLVFPTVAILGSVITSQLLPIASCWYDLSKTLAETWQRSVKSRMRTNILRRFWKRTYFQYRALSPIYVSAGICGVNLFTLKSHTTLSFFNQVAETCVMYLSQ